MEITAPCSFEGCKERITTSGPFSSAIFDAKSKLMREAGWMTVENERGKLESYCPEHAAYVASVATEEDHTEVPEGMENMAFYLIGDGPSIAPRDENDLIPDRRDWESLKAGVDSFYERTTDSYIRIMNEQTRRLK